MPFYMLDGYSYDILPLRFRLIHFLRASMIEMLTISAGWIKIYHIYICMIDKYLFHCLVSLTWPIVFMRHVGVRTAANMSQSRYLFVLFEIRRIFHAAVLAGTVFWRSMSPGYPVNASKLTKGTKREIFKATLKIAPTRHEKYLGQLVNSIKEEVKPSRPVGESKGTHW